MNIQELQERISVCKSKVLPVTEYPYLYFVGRIGEKTHRGIVYLTLDQSYRLITMCPIVFCNLNHPRVRSPQIEHLTGKVLPTCRNCGGYPCNLDKLNKEMKDIIPLIGKEI